MKALVLSGGVGSRLRPFSYSMPKQLVPVGGRPVLEHCLDNLREIGITEVGIIVGDRGGEIAAALGDGSARGQRITYIPQEQPLGLAHCVRIARDFLAEDDFLMFLGDNILVGDGGMAKMADTFHATRPAAQVELIRVDDPRKYGVAVLDEGGRVLRLVEKPADPPSDLAIMGVYLFTPAIHEAVRSIEPSARGELEITDAIQWLVERDHDVRGKVYEGFWKDTGCIDDLLEANRHLLADLAPRVDGKVDEDSTVTDVVVEAGALILRSTIIGPAFVGAGSVISDSRVGPGTAICANCTVSGCEIENSIILEEAVIRDMSRLDGSVIGRSAHVEQATCDLTRNRLVIGDHTRVEVAA